MWSKIQQRGYIKRHEQEYLGEPVGNPYSGPAYGQKNDPGSAIGLGTSILGGIMGDDASSGAANAQVGGAGQAIDYLKGQLGQSRQDLGPFRDTGIAANQRLSYLLGLSSSPTGGNYNPLSITDLVDESQGDWRPNQSLYQSDPKYKQAWDTFMQQHAAAYGVNPNLSRGSDLAQVENQLASQFGLDAYNTSLKDRQAQAMANPEYGSLLRKFSQSDLVSDPVYQSGLQFGLDQGTGALNARAMQSGMYDSGAALKALTRYANDYGSTKANEAYNRYTNDQTNIYNKLMGTSGSGQQATNTMVGAAQNTGNNIADLFTQQGNARASGIVGGANAWGDVLPGIASGATGLLKGLF